jgi:hypothetical protein
MYSRYILIAYKKVFPYEDIFQKLTSYFNNRIKLMILMIKNNTTYIACEFDGSMYISCENDIEYDKVKPEIARITDAEKYNRAKERFLKNNTVRVWKSGRILTGQQFTLSQIILTQPNNEVIWLTCNNQVVNDILQFLTKECTVYQIDSEEEYFGEEFIVLNLHKYHKLNKEETDDIRSAIYTMRSMWAFSHDGNVHLLTVPNKVMILSPDEPMGDIVPLEDLRVY